MRHSPLTSTKKLALVSLISSTAAMAISASVAIAAPAVSGKNGCILKYGGAVVVDHGNKEGSNLQYQKCDPRAYNSFYDARELSFGNFVTSDEVNNAFNQVQSEYQSYVQQQLSGSSNAAKDAEQDGRLGGHDNAISAATSKNREQDNRLAGYDHGISAINDQNTQQDNRLTGHDRDIVNLKDSSVLYDTDAQGKKTGGVTLSDGTGNPVTMGNVAAGKSATDAVNADQLNKALGTLGGGAKLNDDGTIAGPTFDVGGKTYSNVSDALSSTNRLGVQYGADTDGNPTNIVTLTGDATGKQVTITNLDAGKLSTDAVNVSQLDTAVAALGGGAKMNTDGTVQAPYYEVAGLGYNNVGDALKATNETAVQYTTDAIGKRTNEIILSGDGTGPVRIGNVAGGSSDSDAANMRQVKDVAREARSYTDQKVVELQTQSTGQFSALSNQIERNLRETRGGIASAMGMAALRFDNNPGKLSIASGIGNFKGSTSLVAGLGYTSLDGLVRVNASVGYNFGEDDLSVNAGASFTLN